MKTTLAAILVTLVTAVTGFPQSTECTGAPFAGTPGVTRIYTWKLFYADENPEKPGFRKTHTTLVQSTGPNLTIFSMPDPAGLVGQQVFLGDSLIWWCGITDESLDLLFSDGFETGNTSRWTRTVPTP